MIKVFGQTTTLQTVTPNACTRLVECYNNVEAQIGKCHDLYFTGVNKTNSTSNGQLSRARRSDSSTVTQSSSTQGSSTNWATTTTGTTVAGIVNNNLQQNNNNNCNNTLMLLRQQVKTKAMERRRLRTECLSQPPTPVSDPNTQEQCQNNIRNKLSDVKTFSLDGNADKKNDTGLGTKIVNFFKSAKEWIVGKPQSYSQVVDCYKEVEDKREQCKALVPCCSLAKSCHFTYMMSQSAKDLKSAEKDYWEAGQKCWSQQYLKHDEEVISASDLIREETS